MINTAWISFDPMVYGQKLWSNHGVLVKQRALAPNNQRVVFGKAEFEIEQLSFWGSDTKPMCAKLKSNWTFATFKPNYFFTKLGL
jgi:hypothetical protein